MIQLNYYDFKNDYILLTNFYYKQDVLLNIRLLKYINMENNDNLFLLNHPDYDDIHRMCSDAYTKGRMVERSLAIEAYRLRCSNLFGNRCMSRTIFGALSKKTCDGNCWYLNQFKLELYLNKKSSLCIFFHILDTDVNLVLSIFIPARCHYQGNSTCHHPCYK